MSKSSAPNVDVWEMWKQGFFIWEKHTANLMESVLRNPMILGPSGVMMAQVMRAKAKTDKAMTQTWGSLGLPTKHDQERTLHMLNQAQSKLYDLEEQIDALKEEQS